MADATRLPLDFTRGRLLVEPPKVRKCVGPEEAVALSSFVGNKANFPCLRVKTEGRAENKANLPAWWWLARMSRKKEEK